MTDPAPGFQSRVLSGAFWSLAESWTNQFLQFVIFTILARTLAARDFGLVATAVLFGQVFQTTFLQGISTPLVRSTNNERGLDDTGFALSAGLGLLVVLALVISSGWIEHFYGMPGLGVTITALSIANFLASLEVVQQAWLTRNFQLRPMALRSLVATGTGGIVGITMALSGYGVSSLIAQNIVAAFVGVITLWTASPWRPGRRISRASARHILHYGRHVSATGLVNFFNQSSDVLVVGYVLGPAAVGVYVVGKRTLIATNALLSGALFRIALPTFSHVRDDPARVAQVFYRAVRLTSVVTTPAFVGLALVAPECIRLFFGNRWGAAVPVMQALSFFGIIQSLGLYNHALALALGKPQWQTALTFLYAVVNLLTFTLLSRYGIFAIAVAFTIRGYLLYPLSVGMVTRLTPVTVRGYLRSLTVSFAASAVMAVAVLALRPQVAEWTLVPRFAALVGTGALTYTLALLAWGRSDVSTLLSIARGWRPRAA